MAAGDVVGGGQMSDCAAFKTHCRGLRGVDVSARCGHRIGGNFRDRAAEILHDVDAVRVQRLEVVVNRFKRQISEQITAEGLDILAYNNVGQGIAAAEIIRIDAFYSGG